MVQRFDTAAGEVRNRFTAVMHVLSLPPQLSYRRSKSEMRPMRKGASQFLEGSPCCECGKSKCHRLFRQKVSRHIKASSPVVVQNWPGRLKRHWYCRQVDSIAPLPKGSPRLAAC